MRLTFTLLCAFAFAAVPLPATAEPSPLHIVQTKAGTHYAICAEKPAQPAPTLIVIAGPITEVAADKSRWFIATGDALAERGWILSCSIRHAKATHTRQANHRVCWAGHTMRKTARTS